MADTADAPSVADQALALRTCSRSDTVAAMMSLAVPLPVFLVRLPSLTLPFPAWVVALTLAVLASTAGFVAAARCGNVEAPPGLALAAAIRLGARCGAIVFMFGGGLSLLALVGLQLAEAADTGRPARFGPFASAAAAELLAMLPTVVLGSVGALAGTPNALPARETKPVVEPTPKAPAKRGFLPAAVVTFILALASPAVPALLQGRSPGPAVHVAEVPPARERFRYEAPRDLRSAGASRWRIVARRPVPGLFSGAVAHHSGDGDFLAFTGEGGSSLTVFDLVRHEEKRAFPALPGIRSFAWSPDDRRIFCACEGDIPQFLILDLETGSAIRLPLRSGPGHGVPRWTWDEEVGFFSGRRRIAALRLGTLKWKRHGTPPDVEEGDEAEELATTDRCSLSVRPRISSLTIPGEGDAPGWGFEADAMLAVTDKLTDASYALLEDPILEGTAFLVTPDASRITVVTDDGAVTNYVGLAQEDWSGALEGSVPALPTPEPGSPLADLTRDGRIGAFICAPLVNPLGGGVVGPDTWQVRALALFERSGADRVGVRLAESYSPIRPGDVAGCLHYWDGGSPVLLRGETLDDWWSQVSPSADPTAGSAADWGRWREPDLRSAGAAVVFAGWRDPAPRRNASPPMMAAQDLLKKPAGAGKVQPLQPAEPPRVIRISPSGPGNGGNAPVEAFVREHHAKVGRGDADGFAADYSSTVDLRDKGKVDSEFVRRDQAGYQSRYERISETLEGPVAVTRTAEGWRATYVMRSLAARRSDGTEFDRRVRITLDLREAGGRFAIERERAANAD